MIEWPGARPAATETPESRGIAVRTSDDNSASAIANLRLPCELRVEGPPPPHIGRKRLATGIPARALIARRLRRSQSGLWLSAFGGERNWSSRGRRALGGRPLCSADLRHHRRTGSFRRRERRRADRAAGALRNRPTGTSCREHVDCLSLIVASHDRGVQMALRQRCRRPRRLILDPVSGHIRLVTVGDREQGVIFRRDSSGNTITHALADLVGVAFKRQFPHVHTLGESDLAFDVKLQDLHHLWEYLMPGQAFRFRSLDSVCAGPSSA